MSEEVKQEKPAAKREKLIIKDVSGTGGDAKDKELKYQKTFTVDVIEDDGTERFGQFTVKRLTIGDTARVGVIRAQLNGDVTPEAIDAATWTLNEWVAYCRVAVVTAPDWFVPQDMFDSTVLRGVYEEGRSFNKSFRRGGVEE